MPITTWIRDLFGIRKDYIETEKTLLEKEKLEAEKRQRNLITPVSLDDIKKYDPNVRILEGKIEYKPGKGLVVPLAKALKRAAMRHPIIFNLLALIIFAVLIIVVIIWAIRTIWKWLSISLF